MIDPKLFQNMEENLSRPIISEEIREVAQRTPLPRKEFLLVNFMFLGEFYRTFKV